MKSSNRTHISMTIVAQMAAFTIIALLTAILPPLTLFEWALLQGVLAALISYYLKVAMWWIPIQLCFVPAIAATLSIGLSPIWFGAGFCLLALIYGKTYQTQVPLYLSSNAVEQALKSYLPQHSTFSFMDIGSGCGGLLHTLKGTHPQGTFHGVEAAPLPYLISKIRNVILKSDCDIRWGNLWKQNLADYDVVYAYLSPAPMHALWEKIQREMRPGSLFISNTFMIPNVAPDDCIELNDFSGSTLYIWHIQDNKDVMTNVAQHESKTAENLAAPPIGALRPILKNNS